MLMPVEPAGSKRLYFINPDSGAEVARQMRQETIITQAMGGLCAEHPDLTQAHHVLDVCCGPGGWALELAFHYPDIQVIGIDANRNMVEYARAQARVQGLDNAHFLMMDAAGPLRFPDNTFDIVNARFIASFLFKEDWPDAVCEFARVARPGGMIRLTECDELGISTSPAQTQLTRLYARAFSLNGQSFHPLRDGRHICITPMLTHLLRNAGCRHIHEKAHALNYSVDSEAYFSVYENLKVIYKLGQPFLLKMGVATQDELDTLYEQMLFEMLTDDFCAIWYFLTTWGYKPGCP
jgi:ubiquinone/menaquinone biosynthesis C-methylase UbiE